MFHSWKHLLSTLGRFHRLVFHLTLASIIFGTFGCALVTIDTMHNQKLEAQAIPDSTRAKETISTQELPDNLFVGIALSGGGSRAANFSSAVLLELDKLGILNKATAISSVSGSSLPAAYYGLYGGDKSRWNTSAVREQMVKDFELRWIGRWFLPQNILLYWTTNFNRSDIMKEVLDSNLFQGRSFKDMGTALPRILINGTALSDGDRFVFSEEKFQNLRSRLDTYPLANAVMASSAFPGAFHDMTLIDYQSDQPKAYEHILDGGSSDNLGTTTLLDMVTRLYGNSQKPKPKGCFLFVVDAYPFQTLPAHQHDADTRNVIDFIFDTNVAASSDALLTQRRLDLLSTLNLDAREKDIVPFLLNKDQEAIYPDPYSYLQVDCAVWHVSLQRLLAKDLGGDRNVGPVVNAIPTRYKLKGKAADGKTELDGGTLQDYLFQAADELIYKDKIGDRTILRRVCDWFEERGVKDLKCPRP